MCLPDGCTAGAPGAPCHQVQRDILAARVISAGPPPPRHHHLASFLLLPLPSAGSNFPILPGSATRMRFFAITAA